MHLIFDENFLIFIKWVILFQIILITSLILASIVTKIYFHNKNKKRKNHFDILINTLKVLTINNQEVNSKILSLSRKFIPNLLRAIDELDEELQSPHWQKIRTQLIQKVLLPHAKSFTNAKAWFKRYLATRIFELDRQKSDERKILILIKDDLPLVSINAAIIALKYPTQMMINTIIDVFSTGRHIQQSTFAKILAEEANVELATSFIISCIKKEKNPYKKAFCYRLLTNFPAQQEIFHEAYDDIQSNNLELEIAALYYLSHNKSKNIIDILCLNLSNEKWEIRAIAAKLLGKLNAVQSTQLVGKHLRDEKWWVRINAAQALTQMGKEGLAILESQNPESDPYAYDVAQQVLKTKNLSTQGLF
jgi:hypothetical protein